jgi:hypothetical protein
MEQKSFLPGILVKHFELSEQIRRLYPQRKNPDSMNEIKRLCLEMVSISGDVFEELMTGAKSRAMNISEYKLKMEEARKLITGEDSASRVMKETVNHYEEMIAEESKIPNVDKEKFIGPVHIGYDKLFQIYLDECNFDEAETILEKAYSEGWSGDWNKRLDKLEKARKRSLYGKGDE